MGAGEPARRFRSGFKPEECLANRHISLIVCLFVKVVWCLVFVGGKPPPSPPPRGPHPHPRPPTKCGVEVRVLTVMATTSYSHLLKAEPGHRSAWNRFCDHGLAGWSHHRSGRCEEVGWNPEGWGDIR